MMFIITCCVVLHCVGCTWPLPRPTVLHCKHARAFISVPMSCSAARCKRRRRAQLLQPVAACGGARPTAAAMPHEAAPPCAVANTPSLPPSNPPTLPPSLPPTLLLLVSGRLLDRARQMDPLRFGGAAGHKSEATRNAAPARAAPLFLDASAAAARD